MTINPRSTALDILIAYERDGVYPNLLLKKSLKDIKVDRDKRFISALVYGVIEKKLLLDFYISHVSSVKIKKINTVVLSILRIGLYQIVFMSTPASAACNSSVQLAKTNGQIKSAGFVNAVLRKLAQTYESILMPKNKIEYLSVKYSISSKILNVIIDSLGIEKAELFLQSGYSETKKIYIAVNRIKASDDELLKLLRFENIIARKTDIKGLLCVDSGFDIESTAAYTNGYFHVISKPSYICAVSVGAQSGDVIYDMCSAPGGKTFVLSYESADNAKITAFDIYKHKTDLIKKNCSRLGLKNVLSITADSTKLNRDLIDTANRVLCDVPCSGLGMIFRKPDIKYKDCNFSDLIDIQKKILENGCMYLKRGGRLIYSTCTVNVQENNLLIRDFLENNDKIEIDKSINIYNNNYGEKLFLPNTDNMDGFYIAVLRKK